LIAGIGVGFESAIVILYMSEICPKKVRGALVAGYQFCITLGLLLASCVTYGTSTLTTKSSYRIPIGLQFIFGVVLGVGLLFLPESPRFFVKRGRIEQARKALAHVRDQPQDSEYVEAELAEIIANEEYERSLIPAGGWINGWLNCFSGSLMKSNSNLRKTILGTSLQMMQQWTGINFIFYFSTPFLQSTGAITNTFLISLIFTLVNVCSTPISFYTVEKFGRRPLLIWGALGMLICEFLVGIIGDTVGFNKTHLAADGVTTIANNIPAVNAQIAFICIYIFFFASTWGPGAWIVIGEVFPLVSTSPRLSFIKAAANISRVAHPCPWCRPLHRLQLALELHHHRHHALHGEQDGRQPRVQRLLHLGLPLHRRLHLRLLPRPGDQGTFPSIPIPPRSY